MTVALFAVTSVFLGTDPQSIDPQVDFPCEINRDIHPGPLQFASCRAGQLLNDNFVTLDLADYDYEYMTVHVLGRADSLVFYNSPECNPLILGGGCGPAILEAPGHGVLIEGGSVPGEMPTAELGSDDPGVSYRSLIDGYVQRSAVAYTGSLTTYTEGVDGDPVLDDFDAPADAQMLWRKGEIPAIRQLVAGTWYSGASQMGVTVRLYRTIEIADPLDPLGAVAIGQPLTGVRLL